MVPTAVAACAARGEGGSPTGISLLVTAKIPLMRNDGKLNIMTQDLQKVFEGKASLQIV